MATHEVETGTPTLRLNFLALKDQMFSIRVYRKACTSSVEQRAEDDVYRYSLPIDAEGEERNPFWIAFNPHLDFEPYDCLPATNRPLTIRYMSHLLSATVQAGLQPNEYDLQDIRFRHGLDIIVSHSPKGTGRIWIEPCYLAPSAKFGFLVDFHFRKSPEVPFDREVQRLSLSLDKQGYSNKDFYADKYRKLQEFLHEYQARVFPVSGVAGALAIEPELETVAGSRLETRRYVFGGNKEHTAPFSGIDRFGPFTPIEKTIRFALVYSAPERGLVNELASALIGRSKDIAFKGLSQMFQLRIGRSCILEYPRLMARDMPDVVSRLTEERERDPASLLLPLVVLNKADEETYRSLKRSLLEAGFAVQVVTTELLRNRATFKWSVANIALAIFAKAGGQPWCVVPTTNRCVIFGIGQAHDHDAIGKIQRYFSYLVCTDSTGIYRRSDVLGSSSDEQTYLSQLRQKILDAMRQELTAGYTSCVLHIPFKVKRDELRAIETAIGQLQEEAEATQTQFIVLRINDESKYFGYAHTNSLVPFESTFVRVSNSPATYLVWFEGLQLGNPVVRKRPSGPVQVEFYWPQHALTEAEERLLLQDILNLSGCNWRGFNAKHLPISIFYCQLIARQLRRFGTQSIRLDTMPFPWFL